MKWVTFISLLFLFSSAYSRGMFRREAHKSEIINRFKELGEQHFKGLEVARLSQRFSQAEFTDITKMATDLTKIHKESCLGDQLECAHDRVNLFKFICDNQDTFAKKVAACCAKPELERSHCIAELDEDDKPDNLPPITADFAEDKGDCKNYAEAKDIFLGTFLYEYLRRHPEYSSLLLLRIAKAYEARLEKCCAEADPPACYGNVFEEFQPLVAAPQNILGEYKFQNVLVTRYTQKIPQVSTPTLVKASRHLGKVATKCCKLSEAHKMPCVEDYLSAVLNSLFTKCCSESFVNKLGCFSTLQVDDTYTPKEFNAETFTFHADICTLPETEQQIKKQIAFAELAKHKTTATTDQLKAVMGDFGAFLEKSCKAEDKEACFSEEGPKLVAASQAALA
uniref:Albumin n=1 Tax=Sciurus vulgaris TaxID=55149 RepID=A0A8D2D9Z7_SCIVU